MRTIRRDLARYEGILGDGSARPPAVLVERTRMLMRTIRRDLGDSGARLPAVLLTAGPLAACERVLCICIVKLARMSSGCLD